MRHLANILINQRLGPEPDVHSMLNIRSNSSAYWKWEKKQKDVRNINWFYEFKKVL